MSTIADQHGIDRLQIVYGRDFEASKNIVMIHPLVGDIVNMGEEQYLGAVGLLTSIPSDMKSPLYDAGIDWMEISDFQFFCMMVNNLQPGVSLLFIRNVELTEMKMIQRPDGEVILAIPDTNYVIDQLIYTRMVEYIKAVFHITKRPEKAGNAITKMRMIEEDRLMREMKGRKSGKESSMLPLISAMVNSKGFKYNYEEVLKMPFSQFMDAVERTQHIVNTERLSSAVYAGVADIKKIGYNKLDWTKDLSK